MSGTTKLQFEGAVPRLRSLGEVSKREKTTPEENVDGARNQTKKPKQRGGEERDLKLRVTEFRISRGGTGGPRGEGRRAHEQKGKESRGKKRSYSAEREGAGLIQAKNPNGGRVANESHKRKEADKQRSSSLRKIVNRGLVKKAAGVIHRGGKWGIHFTHGRRKALSLHNGSGTRKVPNQNIQTGDRDTTRSQKGITGLKGGGSAKSKKNEGTVSREGDTLKQENRGVGIRETRLRKAAG